jgi:hypothetical protein
MCQSNCYYLNAFMLNKTDFCFVQWMPESARYLVASGQQDKAEVILRQIAKDNGKPMIVGRLVVEDGQMSMRGRVKDLLSPEFRKTSLLLWTIW